LIFKEHTKHDFELAYVAKMPFPLTNREFLGRYLCFKEPAGDLVLVMEALPDSTQVDYGANLKVVRAKTTGVVRFKSINDDTQCEGTRTLNFLPLHKLTQLSLSFSYSLRSWLSNSHPARGRWRLRAGAGHGGQDPAGPEWRG
jgi:hypothetical protein